MTPFFLKWMSLLPLLFPLISRAETLCGKTVLSGAPAAWCLIKNPQSKNPDFVYVLHGGGGDEKSFETSSTRKNLALFWKEAGLDEPTYITFSFGHQWLLGDVATSEHPAYLPIVATQLMPMLEKKLGGLHGRRFLMGHSMGGYNGAELSLRFPNLFSGVALLCPGLSTVNPFATPQEIDAYLARQPATTSPKLVRGIIDWVKFDFRSQEVWNRHDPIRLSIFSPRTMTSYFVSCTKEDEFGFFEGSETFAKNILRKGMKVQWIPVEKGAHCALGIETTRALAKFFSRK